ncbi:MAG TPA: site-2 protease family protein [Desulfobacteria bacterium]|nr:site-2 protease family protein [Desulfobacteria bacterium]
MNVFYLTVILYLFLIYWFIVVALDKKGILERYNISAVGPVLMIRTKRGERLLERLSTGARRERFWRVYANIGTVLVLIAMVFMFVLVAYGTYATFMAHPEPTEINEPRNWLLIPGLNEFIPLSAWVGFVIALVVHELSHAVLSTVEKIKVKSMGLLVALVPIGAFAEPDSEQLFGKKEKEKEKEKRSGEKRHEEIEADAPERKLTKKVATSRERTRILSAGVTSNFCVAFVAFSLFFAILFSVQPISDNVLYVYGVAEGSLADSVGIEPEMFITMVDGSPVTRLEELNTALRSQDETQITVLDKSGAERTLVVPDGSGSTGVYIVGVEGGLPAANAGLTGGMRITRMDSMRITSYEDFSAFMGTTTPAQVIEVETDKKTVTVALAESPYTEQIGFLGVLVANSPLGTTIVNFPTQEYLEGLRSLPHSFITFSPSQWLSGWLWLTIMPIAPLPTGFGGFNPLLAHLYEPVSGAALLGSVIFWTADILFWTGWINFYVGLFNCLPAIPLDGGYVFREMLNPVLRLGIKEEKRKEKVAKAIASFIALFIFSSIVIMLAGPYVL